MLKKLSAI